jgi:hypothetical protein
MDDLKGEVDDGTAMKRVDDVIISIEAATDLLYDAAHEIRGLGVEAAFSKRVTELRKKAEKARDTAKRVVWEISRG